VTIAGCYCAPRDHAWQYLSLGLARHLASLFSHAELHVVEGASHWPQADQPETVARILKAAR